MPRIARADILKRFRAMIRRREPIIGGGAGTGLSAKCEEAGGIDLIVIYNSGRYRMAGRGSLAGLMAYGNANDIVLDMAREVLPVVKHTPVLAGVNGTDPFMITEDFLSRLATLGFSGVQNFPTVGLFDGTIRAQLEETGMGYGLEVEMIRAAHARLLELSADSAVEEAHGGKVLHPREPQRGQPRQEVLGDHEGVRAVDAGEHRRALDHGQHLPGHVQHDVVGIAVGHEAGE